MPKKTFFNLPPEKKQKIIDATYDIFIAEEYENVTIRGIASKAGISIGSFYQYFHDKDDLYLYLLTDIEKRIMTKQKEKYGSVFLEKESVSLEEVCTKKEIDFNRTWYKVPIEVMRKFYFGEYAKELNSFVMDELIELKNSGKLKDSIDIELIFHLYVTSMFNMLIYFRDQNITDEDEKFEIKNNFYTDIFLNGILKAE
ncbi:TetR/AcrR family transcriptional regulator [Paramaledivibacter caminithermalis]|jgi:AcrR family transcriptional regulator|uniref:Transcriptional regulator, TetR family n=1 Tax=Paramaledivibacter caminithermalis (strain DSM 15212 / CIP 107654 / DViRD3) TaxID=1121301 RepID=A0A1M6PDH5_PARC5|nr:TetR/AcrR family transcriptional regulator [Paramaledivibacter caminithermalis]SHK06003.1 transcriptional regulator, TetR family [Paramaledivibacter caminithermalis DSM 15212]